MKERFNELLLDYVLGAVDEAEQQEIERRLEEDPGWRDELRRVERALKPLAGLDKNVAPPPQLGSRTCQLVSARIESDRVCPPTALAAAHAPLSFDSFGQGKIAEFVVAAGILFALAMLFFPAISTSRELARSAQCHHNLMKIGMAMAAYSDQSIGGYFPGVPTHGNRAFAGIYAPILFEGGYLVDPSDLICSSSPLADQRMEFSVPSLAQIDESSGIHLVALRRQAGGSYGYHLGYLDRGTLRPPQNMRRPHFAVVADDPSWSFASDQHTSRRSSGANFLFEDGSVRYVVNYLAAGDRDHPFRNHHGVVEPGVNQDDVVIAPGYVSP